MPYIVQLHRLPSSQAETYVGPQGEIIMDTGANTLRIQDGVTPGGYLVMQGSNNLGELTNIAQARETLQLGSAALNNTGDFDVSGAAAAVEALVNLPFVNGAKGSFQIPGTPFIIKWVTYTANRPGSGVGVPGGLFWDAQTITWNAPFPNGCLATWLGPVSQAANSFFVSYNGVGTTTEVIAFVTDTQNVSPFNVLIFALGY